MAAFFVLVTAFGFTPLWPLFQRFFTWRRTSKVQISLKNSKLHIDGVPESYKGWNGQFCWFYPKPEWQMSQMECRHFIAELNELLPDPEADIGSEKSLVALWSVFWVGTLTLDSGWKPALVPFTA